MLFSKYFPVTADTMPGGFEAAGFYPPACWSQLVYQLVGEYAEAYMNNLNSVLIEGNMVRDPLFRSTQKGTSVCNFSIASNRFYKKDQLEAGFEQETGFFDVEVWGKLAEICSVQGRKGRGVRVVGRLKQERWAGTDGKSHTKVAIVAEHVEYRPDFKKPGDGIAKTGVLAEAAAPELDDTSEGLDEFTAIQAQGSEAEEYMAVNF